MVTHVPVASSKPKVELDSHADTSVIGDKCLVSHDHYRPVNVYSHGPKDGHKGAKTVDGTVGSQDPKSGQRFILVINQAIYLHRCLSQPFFMPNAVSPEWHANQ